MFADWLRGALVRLSQPERQRLAAWRALPVPAPGAAHCDARFVVVDVETSGLDVFHDRLIAIGAVAVSGARIALAAHFHVVLRQPRPSDDTNILVHGIGGTAQAEGVAPRKALLDFLDFAGRAPLVAFHAPFDAIMLRRALRRHLGEPFRPDWLDLAWLAPALEPAHAPRARSLDDWTHAFGIGNAQRHHALADALATAQLLLALQSRAGARGLHTVDALFEAARGEAWLGARRPRLRPLRPGRPAGG